MNLSIIIPTRNESESIPALLKYLGSIAPEAERIVADGGSTDDTAELAAGEACVVHAATGRGIQMNAGARRARGSVLWFLHADCRPHPASVARMVAALEDPGVVGGAFEYALDHPHFYFRAVEFLSNRKNRLLKLFYGDMGIFVRKGVFEALGGYAEIPLMEDMDFCRRLKKRGRVTVLPCRMRTSARRWEQEGLVKTAVRNWALQIAWALGVSPEILSRYYRFP